MLLYLLTVVKFVLRYSNIFIGFDLSILLFWHWFPLFLVLGSFFTHLPLAIYLISFFSSLSVKSRTSKRFLEFLKRISFQEHIIETSWLCSSILAYLKFKHEQFKSVSVSLWPCLCYYNWTLSPFCLINIINLISLCCSSLACWMALDLRSPSSSAILSITLYCLAMWFSCLKKCRSDLLLPSPAYCNMKWCLCYCPKVSICLHQHSYIGGCLFVYLFIYWLPNSQL